MNGILRRASLTMATAAAAAGFALPAAAAHADEPLPCPRVFGVVCAWTQHDGHGRLRLIRHPERLIVPPVRSVQNQSHEDWCLYDRPEFQGRHRRELARGQTIRNLGFEAFSARPGSCYF